MPRKSTIDRLPPDVKDYISGVLASNKLTLDELISELNQRFPQHKEIEEMPSRSALGRYGQKLQRRLSAIRASTEAAKIIQAQAGDNQDARSGALTALIQTELFEAILNLQEADDPDADPADRVGMLSTAAKNIATLTRSSVNLKQFQAKVEAEARSQLMAEQEVKLKELASTDGMSEKMESSIRRILLGKG